MTSHPINTALCSFGMSGRLFHAPFLHAHPGFRFHAAWERSKKLVSAAYPGVISYDSFEQLLDDPEIELLIVNTPNYTHFEFAERALMAGKHVVVEKPFCISSSECTRLIGLAKEKSLCLSVYQNRRWDSDFQLVRQIVESGELGTLAEAEIHFDRFNLALSSKTHKEQAGPGTGLLYDLGSHLIDQALLLFGWPDELMADIEIMRPASQVSDYFEIVMRYGKLRVRLKSGYIVKEPLPAYVLHGMNGSFLKTRCDRQEADLLAGIDPRQPGWGVEDEQDSGLLVTGQNKETVKRQLNSPPGNYMSFFQGLHNAIRNQEKAPVTGEDGRRVIRIIEAAMKSHSLRKWVHPGESDLTETFRELVV